jgi:Uma2 family endonuclease
MATHTLMTAEQFDQLPEEEGRRYELLDGELIEMPSANLEHNLILKNGLFELEGFFRRTEIGTVVPEMEFAFGDDRFRPDLAVLLADKLKQASLKRVPLTVVPDIVLEIVSPSESAINLDRKVRVYLQAGVAEVWVIYPDGQHMLCAQHRKRAALKRCRCTRDWRAPRMVDAGQQSFQAPYHTRVRPKPGPSGKISLPRWTFTPE